MEIGVLVLLGAAGVAAGGVNAVAGGGSLIMLPVLLAFGVPPIQATVTNSISVTGGYSASVLGTRQDLRGQGPRLRALMPTVLVGAVTGCVLLLHTPPGVYAKLMPLLVLAASLLLAFQQRVGRLVGEPHAQPVWLRFVLLFLVGVYGGYFNSVLGVILIAVLSVVVVESLNRVVALKNSLQLVVGVVATTMYTLFGPVYWPAVAVLVPATLLGGFAGARAGRRLPARTLRAVIVAFGVTVAGVLFLRAMS
ncbi:sulfite exporter TauE/SafE family protein [Catellatospora methionotrophica]|uniref:sulfite exporter TauE/SafE family protein n=1 Tax=Catellatospora methionotrophica TaxID=121620 RepID=UPI0033D4071B